MSDRDREVFELIGKDREARLRLAASLARMERTRVQVQQESQASLNRAVSVLNREAPGRSRPKDGDPSDV